MSSSVLADAVDSGDYRGRDAAAMMPYSIAVAPDSSNRNALSSGTGAAESSVKAEEGGTARPGNRLMVEADLSKNIRFQFSDTAYSVLVPK